jgi:beta-lactamase class A
MLTLVEEIHRGKLVSEDACKEMLGHLKKCEDKDKFTRFLPEKTVVAHKTGAVSDAKTDAGIIYTKAGPVALCVLTNQNEDKTWRTENEGCVVCARVAQQVYDHFTAKKGQ